MPDNSDTCALCGLPTRFGNHRLDAAGRSYRFCCMGCRQVFAVLMAATGSADPADFRQSALFRQCRAAGIIPASEDDLQPAAAAEGDPLMLADPAAGDNTGTDRPSLTLQLRVSGMWCAACAWVIDATLKNTPGIIRSTCNFSTDRLRCEYDPVRSSPTQILEAIARLGYSAAPADNYDRSGENRREFVRFGVAAVLTMNVMMLSFALYSGFFNELTPDAVSKLSWPIFLLSSAVLVYGGKNIFRKAVTGVFSAAAGMETLIATGTLSAYLYSVYNFTRDDIHLYFDTAAMLITLVLLGKLLERRTKNRVLEDLDDFFSLLPTKVRICTEQFPLGRYAAVDQLARGDVFCVDASDVVPADGIVRDGGGQVDESSLTGEARPVDRKSGDRVLSGTRILRGRFRVKAEAVGEDSTLGQMIRIIEGALNQKAQFEGKTDRWLTGFVPLVLLLATGTGLIGLLRGLTTETAVIRAVTVMVISCPCALGVAIPLARVAGISAAGRIGLLVRNFAAFERADSVDAVVFDKTGTLTEGRWRLLAVEPAESGVDPDAILAAAAALEAESDHHVALEIKREARRRGRPTVAVTDIRMHDNGVSGRLGGVPLRLGSMAFVGSAFDGGADRATAADTDHAGRSAVYLSRDGRPWARLVFGDTLRAASVQTVRQLQRRGVEVALVSGDDPVATGRVAAAAGIATARGGLLPSEKVQFVKALQDSGRRVAMVGDGINDAPAMAQANLAVAVHSGSHLGKEAADVTLMRGDPHQLLDFFHLARLTNRKVVQNLWFSFLYNIIGIPVAMMGLLNPLVAVSAMLLSSLTVIGNTLLLANARPRR
jgi:heavy metal translocating P-type ATPase